MGPGSQSSAKDSIGYMLTYWLGLIAEKGVFLVGLVRLQGGTIQEVVEEQPGAWSATKPASAVTFCPRPILWCGVMGFKG